MKLSLYTFVRNGLYLDYHIKHMLRHHLPLADEIVVNEGYSTDGTYEEIQDIDPKIRIIRQKWDFVAEKSHRSDFKNAAAEQCTGDWCVLLDCDEFIPEWQFDVLRTVLATTSEEILPVQFTHFYANFKVCARKGRRVPPDFGYRIHRNQAGIRAWGDGSNVWYQGEPPPLPPRQGVIDVHHFGEVRHPARLRQKWRMQAIRHGRAKAAWLRIPAFMYSLFPHRWLDPDILPHLEIYNGPNIACIQDDPDEFVRDKFKVYKHLHRLRQRESTAVSTSNENSSAPT
jgi:glycosyltransferase involved in cell wall biosynthesis